MEIFQTIWNVLTTPNEGLTNILILPLAFVEIAVTMLFFTTILNINCSKKQKLTYFFIASIWTILSTAFISKQISVFINMIIPVILITIIFRLPILKSILAEILPTIVIALLDTLCSKICFVFFNVTQYQAITTPIFRISVALVIYLVIFCIYLFMKHFTINISILDSMSKRNKHILLFTLVLIIVTIATQFYLIGYYNELLPFSITLLTLVSLLAYFFVSMYTLYGTTQLQITEQNLEEAQLYNKSLKILHDNVRAFKHDFSNIVQSIGRVYWFK